MYEELKEGGRPSLKASKTLHDKGCEHKLAAQLKEDLEKQGKRVSNLLPPS